MDVGRSFMLIYLGALQLVVSQLCSPLVATGSLRNRIPDGLRRRASSARTEEEWEKEWGGMYPDRITSTEDSSWGTGEVCIAERCRVRKVRDGGSGKDSHNSLCTYTPLACQHFPGSLCRSSPLSPSALPPETALLQACSRRARPPIQSCLPMQSPVPPLLTKPALPFEPAI